MKKIILILTITLTAVILVYAITASASTEQNHTDTTLTAKEQVYTTLDKRVIAVDEDSLDLLARAMYAEAGCDWIPDDVALKVGSVILNRVHSPLYPNTISDVVYQSGQYETDCLYNKEPSKRIRDLAYSLLKTGSILPPEVLGQNGYGCINGCGDEIYEVYHDEILGTTIYFTYIYS